jgi:hypothetical protein
MPMESQPLFEETQEPAWIYAMLPPGATAASVLAVARAVSLGARFGAAGLAAVATGLALRELVFPMETVLVEEELRIRFGRRMRYRIPLKNITRAFYRAYSPLAEYGGWGIRTGKQGRAFNMRGNEGVQLVLRSGQRVLIGSQRPEELVRAIQKATGCATTPEETA